VESGVNEGGEVFEVGVVLQGLVEERVNGAGRGGVVEEGDCSLEDVVECGEDAGFECEGDSGGGGG
jgi:hypothetical protein